MAFGMSTRPRSCWPVWPCTSWPRGWAMRTLRVYAHVIRYQMTKAADIFAKAIDQAA
jgi:hypothetical protein